MSSVGTLVSLAIVFGQISIIAFGGTNSVIPEMHRQVVDLHQWLTGREFVALYALAQAAPGPNMMVVSLIGWQVAGVAGAITATLAVSVPSSILTLLVSGVWYRFRDATWRKALQKGLMPVTAGLIMASAALFIEVTTVSWGTVAVIAVTCPLFLMTKLHPLLILGAAAAIGALGVIA